MANEFDSYLDELDKPAPAKNEFDSYLEEAESAKPEDTASAKAVTEAAPEKLPDSAFKTGGLREDAESVLDFGRMIGKGVALAGSLGEYAGAGLGAITTDKSYGESLDEIRKINQQKDQAAAARSPTAAMLGEAGGAVVTPAPGLSGAGKLESASRILGSAALSAADKAARADNLEAAADTAIESGIVSGGAQAALEAAGPLGKWLKSFANRRAVKSLDPTLAQQQVLNNKDVVDELGDALLEAKVPRFGSSVEGMAPRLDDMLSETGKRIGATRQAADEAGAQVDTDWLRRIGQMQQEAAGTSNEASQAMANSYLRNAERLAKRPSRNLRETQEEIMSLNEQIPFNKPMAERTSKQQAYSELRGDLVHQMDDQIRQKVPDQLAQYLKDKRQFSLFSQGDEILDKSVARSARNADVGLRDLLMGNMAKGKEGGVGGTMKGVAAAAATKLVRERGNATAAVMADKVSKVLRGTPDAFGKWAAPLMEAQKRGNKAFMATHLMLMKNDPEYAATVEGVAQEPVE